MGGEGRPEENTVAVDTAAAIERFLAGPAHSDATRRAYRSDLADFASWLREQGLELDEVDVRALAGYTAELGRARRGLAPTTIARRLSAVRSLMRHALGPVRVPEAALAPRRPRRLPETPTLAEVEQLVDRAGDTGDGPLVLRNGALLELVYSCGLRSAEAVALISATSTSTASMSMCVARAARSAWCRSARRPPGASDGWLRDGRALLARDACDALFLSVRGRRLETSTLRRLVAQPAPAPPRVRDAPPRGRR